MKKINPIGRDVNLLLKNKGGENLVCLWKKEGVNLESQKIIEELSPYAQKIFKDIFGSPPFSYPRKELLTHGNQHNVKNSILYFLAQLFINSRDCERIKKRLNNLDDTIWRSLLKFYDELKILLYFFLPNENLFPIDQIEAVIKSETPDFIIKLQNNNFIGIEITDSWGMYSDSKRKFINEKGSPFKSSFIENQICEEILSDEELGKLKANLKTWERREKNDIVDSGRRLALKPTHISKSSAYGSNVESIFPRGRYLETIILLDLGYYMDRDVDDLIYEKDRSERLSELSYKKGETQDLDYGERSKWHCGNWDKINALKEELLKNKDEKLRVFISASLNLENHKEFKGYRWSIGWYDLRQIEPCEECKKNSQTSTIYIPQ